MFCQASVDGLIVATFQEMVGSFLLWCLWALVAFVWCGRCCVRARWVCASALRCLSGAIACECLLCSLGRGGLLAAFRNPGSRI